MSLAGFEAEAGLVDGFAVGVGWVGLDGGDLFIFCDADHWAAVEIDHINDAVVVQAQYGEGGIGDAALGTGWQGVDEGIDDVLDRASAAIILEQILAVRGAQDVGFDAAAEAVWKDDDGFVGIADDLDVVATEFFADMAQLRDADFTDNSHLRSTPSPLEFLDEFEQGDLCCCGGFTESVGDLLGGAHLGRR